MIHKLQTKWEKYAERNRKKIANDIYTLYKNYSHNITTKWIDPLALLCVGNDSTGTSPSDVKT